MHHVLFQEFDIMRALPAHENLVSHEDLFFDKTHMTTYLVMELAEGTDL